MARVVPAAAPAIADYSPVAAMRAVEEIETTVARGFNYGVRLVGRTPVGSDPSLRRRSTTTTPSLEVANVAGDSAVGRDRIQSAPDL